MSTAAFGSLAAGLSHGLERGQAMSIRADEQNYRRGQRQREAKYQAQEDADLDSLNAANEAGAEVMRRYQQDWQKQPGNLGLDGGVRPFRPTPQMALEAGRARTDKLLATTGPTRRWMETWAQDEAMRNQVRTGAAQKVQQALTTGVDPVGPITEFFDTIDDGYKVKGVTPGVGKDGKAFVSIDRINRYTGQPAPQPMVIPVDQLLTGMTQMAANPADLAKHSLQMNLEAFKQAGTRSEITARGEESRKTEGVKHGHSLAEIDRRNAGDLDVAKARNTGAKSTERAEAIRALGQERTSVDNEIRTLVQQLKDARPTDRPGIQTELDEARERAKDVRKRLSALSAGNDASLGDAQGGAPLDAVMRDAQKQGLSSFDVELPSVNSGKRTRISLGDSAPQPAPDTAPAAGKPRGVAKPTNKAEYDALPSGALYERDGKTYRKQ